MSSELLFVYTAPCAIEAEFSNAECVAVHGAMTVYYLSSANNTATDEVVNIEKAVKAAVKQGMNTNVPVTDTAIAVFYIGDRDNFSVTTSLFMRNNEGELTFWNKSGAKLAVGLSSAVFAVFLLLICCRMRNRDKRENLSAFDNDVEVGHELASKRSFKSKKSKTPFTNEETEVEEDPDDFASPMYGLTCCWK